MAGVIYHEVKPEQAGSNENNSFREFNTLSFILQADGRKLVKNSISIDFEIRVYSGNYVTDVLRSDIIGYNNKVGCSSFWESFTCEVQSKGVISQQNEYPRYVNMVNSATKNENDVCSGILQAQGIGALPEVGRYYCQRQASNNLNAGGAAGHVYDNSNFSFMPKIPFNSMSGDNYSFSKNGYIRIQTNLAKNNNALFGRSAGTATYEIINPRLRFTSVPDDGQQGIMLMNTYSAIKQTINSQKADIVARVPLERVSGVAVTYLELAKENSNTADSYRLEKIPQISSLQYLMNNSTSGGLVSYQIDDRDEMNIRGLQALSNNFREGNQVSHIHLKGNSGTLHGQSFGEYLNLSNQTFNMAIESESNLMTVNPYLVYMYFLGLIQL